MPTQKVFKKRVRTRMTKTGESYTAARRQLLHKANASAGPESVEPAPVDESPPVDDPAVAPELLTSDNAMRRVTGKGHEEWFALLDAWGATDSASPGRRRTEATSARRLRRVGRCCVRSMRNFLRWGLLTRAAGPATSETTSQKGQADGPSEP